MLFYLVDHPGQLVTKQALLDAVWPGPSVSDSMPAVCVKELRKILGDEAKVPRFIQTVHGRGYRFTEKLTSDAPASMTRRPPVPAAGNRPLIVGREDGLAQIQSWYSQVLEGQRKVVFIASEAGIGKTALVRAFFDSIADAGQARLVRGQCVEQYGAGEIHSWFSEGFDLPDLKDAEALLEDLSRQPIALHSSKSLYQDKGATQNCLSTRKYREKKEHKWRHTND